MIDYGVVRTRVGYPPSRNGTPVLAVFLPTELARAWPASVTHVRVLADESGVRLEPIVGDPPAARGEPRPVPFAS